MFAQSDKKFTVCSIFSGGGLFDFGFKQNFDIVWANEMSMPAAICYQANIGNHVQVGDLTTIKPSDIPHADGYIGGPPCIDFSSTGSNRGELGNTGRLIWVYYELIKIKKPKFFIYENVLGMANRHPQTLSRLIQAFEEAGYNLSSEILNASSFGTPQSRERIFIAGIRKDLGFTFKFPVPCMKKLTVREAIGDLPQPENACSGERVLGSFPNHVATWESPTPERIVDVIQNPRSQWRGMRRLSWDALSPTLTAHIAKDGREHLHPEESRRITVREALRLMAVPDCFVIPAKVPLSHQYRIVGNGIAFPVATALASAMRVQLETWISSTGNQAS
ncbi:DNA cytosine methyltransferase [Paenibacillus ihuae]|uniref:DNA cytosine methyltransferase n=1 Tax=Paenibacillus ihuae TaxID=1232431 RepID=UPI0009E7CDBF|nr:DNA (cytosine-5-)-methyltransferase [Paenibacillus ihuae]